MLFNLAIVLSLSSALPEEGGPVVLSVILKRKVRSLKRLGSACVLRLDLLSVWIAKMRSGDSGEDVFSAWWLTREMKVLVCSSMASKVARMIV